MPHLRIYGLVSKYHDLFIVLAWTLILAGIMLNTFYKAPQDRALNFAVHGTCSGAIPCQSNLDLALVFAAAIGAGLLLEDLRVVLVGFVIVHVLATGVFIGFLTAPVYLGLTDPVLSDTIISLSIIIAFWIQIPLALILSLSGSVVGFALGSKLRSGTE